MGYQNREAEAHARAVSRSIASNPRTDAAPKAPSVRDIALIGFERLVGQHIQAAIEETFPKKSAVRVTFGEMGIEALLHDPATLERCRKANLTVLQIPAASTISNRFYTVVRADPYRIIRPSSLLQTIYNGVDFSGVRTTDELLSLLHAKGPDKFDVVRNELRDAWIARMRSVATELRGKLVLVALPNHSLDDAAACDALGNEPLFVTRAMLAGLKSLVKDVLEMEIVSGDLLSSAVVDELAEAINKVI
ncbi:DUF6473 family protein [Celeribacter litoreus]|uniref:DUF6473 family protein n=1 Tax=Celeribacter litoreus TaxID=2876714 RepID=UPI001CCE051D|nr:DUF6473 family protein [Celeribacter litoreus]MCA0042382.1 DUF6473 family protein [Celeribacter litoreus]